MDAMDITSLNRAGKASERGALLLGFGWLVHRLARV